MMKPAQDRLATDLLAITFSKPAVRVVCNADAALLQEADLSRDALIRQVTSSVKWDRSMRVLIGQNVQTFVEVGPGKVLCGLMRQIDRSKTSLNVSDETSLQKTLDQLADRI
jgi:[acyl-carrier-protein] S-malonyltransferase